MIAQVEQVGIAGGERGVCPGAGRVGTDGARDRGDPRSAVAARAGPAGRGNTLVGRGRVRPQRHARGVDRGALADWAMLSNER